MKNSQRKAAREEQWNKGNAKQSESISQNGDTNSLTSNNYFKYK